MAGLVEEIEARRGPGTVGIGIPGSLSPATGLVRNANSVWLNGKPFKQDLERALAREVRLCNDANCMALSEAADGAGAGAQVVFAAILGTGVGGGVVLRGEIVEGRNGIGGEWGHTPLPWPRGDELPGAVCWCGRENCLETWISGPGMARDFRAATGYDLTAVEIAARARSGDTSALAALDRYIDRLARGLAVIADIIDPSLIVLAGGMSNVRELYDRVSEPLARHVFSDVFTTPVRKTRHGDSSGVRGAARLWPPAS